MSVSPMWCSHPQIDTRHSHEGNHIHRSRRHLSTDWHSRRLSEKAVNVGKSCKMFKDHENYRRAMFFFSTIGMHHDTFLLQYWAKIFTLTGN